MTGRTRLRKRRALEQLEPMEVAQYYTERYHRAMDALNVLSPSIEPRASGHIIEQIALVKEILDHGFAYLSNGSVYFDVEKYNEKYHYGRLSGRNLEDIVTNTRDLDGQGDKRHSYDFALWEEGIARTYHALAFALERGISRVAPGVYGHEYQIPGRAFDIHGEAWT